MNNRTICYEFLGIWGSGKTTLINDLSKKLIKRGVVVKSFIDFYKEPPLKRYFMIILFILKNPLFSIKLIYFLTKIFYKLLPLNNLQIDMFKTLVKNILIKNYIISKQPEILLSEGIYHILTSFDKLNKLSLKEIFFCVNGKFLSKLNHIVHIGIDKDLALKNIIKDSKNGFFRFSKNDFDNKENLLISMLANQNLIIKKIQFSKINIYYINRNSSFSNKVKYLFNLINDVSNQKKSYLYND
jgi:hypothetical protein